MQLLGRGLELVSAPLARTRTSVDDNGRHSFATGPLALPASRLESCFYLIAAKASTCNNKSGLDNCGARIVVLFGEGGPK